MAYVEKLGRRILLGQLSMLLYSVILAILGPSHKSFLIAFILMIVLMYFMNKSNENVLGQRKVPPEHVLEGKKLFEETNVRELQTSDTEIVKDMQEQSRFTMYSSLGMFISFFYFILLWKYIEPLHKAVLPLVGNDRLALFIAFLVYFEGLFIINQAFMVWSIRKVGKVTMFQMPMKYTVTDKGIVIGGLVGKQTITFPLPPDVYIDSNERRRYVEIIRHGKRTVTRIRFYTRRVKRLEEILRKYGKARKLEKPQQD